MDAMIFSTGKFIGFDNSGQIIPYGNVYFTDAVSGLPITTYQDSAMTAENTYPVVLSASGKADIFLKDASYDITLKDKNFATVWTINNFVPPIGSSSVNEAINEAMDTLKKDEITYPIDTINDLKSLTIPYNRVWVSGYYTKGDGAFGSNIFEWDDASVEADNSTTIGTIIKLNSVTTGRYKLKYKGNTKDSFSGKMYDLFVIYGQSNAFGFAGNTPGRNSIPENCYFWTNRVGTPTWNKLVYDMEYVQPGASNSDGHAWVEFAREYKARTGKGVLFLPAAMGGKSLTELSKGTSYYDRLVLSLNQIEADSTHLIDNKYMLFSQGENDMTDGTSRESYQTIFQQFWGDIKTDTDITKLFMSKVGNPQDRTEVSRYPIQVAQDYLSHQTPDVFMAFSDAGSFTISNGLLRTPGIHYTQKGYNIMGREMGRFASIENTIGSASTELDLKTYANINTPTDVQHNAVACTLYHNGTDWSLKSISDGGAYRSSFVESITVNSDSITINTSSRTSDVVTMLCTVNNKDFLDVEISKGTSDGIFVIKLYADITAFVDTSTGAISYPPNGTGIDNGLLSDLSAVIDSGITKLSYSACVNTPIVTPYTTSSLTEFVPIAQKNESGQSVWFKYQGTVTENNAIVNFKRKLVDPSAITLSGLQIQVYAIVGERAL